MSSGNGPPDASAAVAGVSGKTSVSRTWLRAIETAAKLTADKTSTVADLIDDLGRRFGAAPALLDDVEVLSFEDLAARARQYTRWALSVGLGAGDSVALLMPNRADYFAFWVGVSRTGAAVALLNTHLKGAALAHCIEAVNPRHLVVDEPLMAALEGARAYFHGAPRIWRLGSEAHDGGEALASSAFSPEAFPPASFPSADQAAAALYIFTSGTTGLPKAARISHGRILSWSGWFAGLLGAGPSDRMYNCLPMYHSVGGVTAIGAALTNGASVVLRERFSATRFWSEVAAWDCTLFQYIGELCRYLLAKPFHPDERRHRLRMICGNGLREDVWTQFQARFAIPAVLEFYAATEGSFSLFNVEGKPGAIGRTPPFLAHRFPAVLVRFDAEAEVPARDADGRCIACAVGEIGEAIGRVPSARGAGAAAFEGYTDPKATDEKLLRDVFEPGDVWFRTGDLMRKDTAGFFYFIDRIGETFRWKGENVSTQEVADTLGRYPGVRHAVVYGVEFGPEGRAGMTALVVEAGFELARLMDHLIAHLPVFARPLFLRIGDSLPMTETFKVKKQALMREGYDPGLVVDSLYWFDPDRGLYEPLDADVYARLLAPSRRS